MSAPNPTYPPLALSIGFLSMGAREGTGWGYEKSRYGYDVSRIFSLTGHHPQQSLMNLIYFNQSAQLLRLRMEFFRYDENQNA
jgi:hypothetical protein